MRNCVAILCCFIAVLDIHGQEKDFEDLLFRFSNARKPNVLVAAHRGDWRNAPENSLQSLENAIRMGVDIYELDVQMSKDSVLILMHDQTLDRTVNTKGKPEDFTMEELKSFRLRNGLGRPTSHIIPTLEEFLLSSRNRILVDVDKAQAYFPQVISLVQKLNMENQVIVNVNAGVTLDELEHKFGPIPENIILMPVINLDASDYERYFISFNKRQNTIFQPIFKKVDLQALDFAEKMRDKGHHIWFNSLWPSLNAGHDDDTAVEQGKEDETWGWIIKQRASIIQTDRPRELLKYLE